MGRYGTDERNDKVDRMTAITETNKLFCRQCLVSNESGTEMYVDCAECKSKNEIDYVLIDVLRILKVVSVIPSVNTGNDRRMLWARIILAVENRVLNVSGRHKRSTETDKELEREVTDWTMTEAVEASLRNFSAQKKPNVPSLGEWTRESPMQQRSGGL